MSNTDVVLRKEYGVALENFIQQAYRIAKMAEDDPLLKAQVMITIIKCEPKLDDFRSLKEVLLKIGPQDRWVLAMECLKGLTPLRNASQSRDFDTWLRATDLEVQLLGVLSDLTETQGSETERRLQDILSKISKSKK